MDSVTLGQISNELTFLIEFATIIVTISTAVYMIFKKLIKPMELLSIKSDLVNFINDVEMGIFKTHIQKLIAHDLYDRYKKLGGNSYIHEHWERLDKEGKI